MADMTYDLFSIDNRRAEVQRRLGQLEQRHYVLKLDEKTGVPMSTESGMTVNGVPQGYTGLPATGGETPEETREKEVGVIEKAVTELRKELADLDKQAKAQFNNEE